MAASPQSLFDLASCYTSGCLGPTNNAQTLRIGLLLNLLTALGGGGSSTCQSLEGSGSPVGVVVPEFEGQLYRDTDDDIFWYSTGLTNTDWTEINPAPAAQGFVWGPAPETVDFIVGNNDSIESALETIFTGMSYTDYDFGQPTTVTNGIAITNCSNMTSLSFRLLEYVEDNLEANTNTALVSFSAAALTEIAGGSLDLTDCDVLASVSVPSLVTLGASWLMTGCPLLASLNATSLQTVAERFEMTSTSLPSISLPSLASVGEGFLCNDNVLLESFSAPLWLPTDGAEINFDNCALDATSVNHVLARCVAAGVTTSTIELANGTNAAPTGQGLVDKADLITAGNTVNTN